MGEPYTDNSLRFAAGILVYAGIIIATALFIRRFSVKNEKSAPRLFCIVVLATTAVSEFCSLGLNVGVRFGNLPENRSEALGLLILGVTFYVFNMLIYHM